MTANVSMENRDMAVARIQGLFPRINLNTEKKLKLETTHRERKRARKKIAWNRTCGRYYYSIHIGITGGLTRMVSWQATEAIPRAREWQREECTVQHQIESNPVQSATLQRKMNGRDVKEKEEKTTKI